MAEVQHLEGAEGPFGRFQFTLHLDQALARGVDGELAEVGADPLAAEFLGDGGGGAAAAEEVGDEVALVAAGLDDSFKQCFGFLGGIVLSL